LPDFPSTRLSGLLCGSGEGRDRKAGLAEVSDEEAVAIAHALFAERKNLFEGFEVWDRARKLIAHPHLTSPENSATSLSPDNPGAA
jgi:hypothetical protein